MAALQIKTPRAFLPLLSPSRYKCAYGGRGSGKSWFFAGLMVEEHARNPGMRSVCLREVQLTLKESSKRLIEDTLTRYGLGEADGFRVLNEHIETPGDGIIIFRGLQDYSAENIKSLEGMDRAWCEEAQTITTRSLQLLRPTIRKPGSEMWFSWNPRLKSDAVDALFRGKEIPTGSIVINANWNDNPFFTAELEQERQDDMRINPDQYPHIWEGDYVTVITGAYYAQHIAKARAEHRIGHVPADPLITHRLWIDIGGTGAKADAFSIWVTQFVGKEIRVIDYYEAVGQEFPAHVYWMQSKGYMPHNSNIYLPHDGVNHDRVYSVSYEGEFRRAGYHVETIPNQGQGAAMQRIEALRKVFPMLWFDGTKCQAGIDAIGWYHSKRDEKRGIDLGPEHDWSSHAADALGLMAIKADEIQAQMTPRKPAHSGGIAHGGWMS